MGQFNPFVTPSGGSTSDYNDLENKPQINGNTLQGNMNSSQIGLGAAASRDVDTVPTQDSTNLITSGGVYTVIGDINAVLEEVL